MKKSLLSKYNPASRRQEILSRIDKGKTDVELYEEILLGKSKSANGKKKNKEGRFRGNQNVVVSLSSRLKKVESLNAILTKDITIRDETISQLREELRVMKRLVGEKNVSSLSQLALENERLRQKISEMNNFLENSGLEWIGSKTLDAVLENPNGDFTFDISTFLKSVELLNVDAKAEVSPIVLSDSGLSARIQDKTPVLPLTIYSDGIFISRGPFRSFYKGADGGLSARQFVEDICAGYFPYELRRIYPNGVKLKVKNRSDEKRREGRRLSKVSERSIRQDEDYESALSMRDFLKAIPEKSIVGGSIINTRNDIAKKLGSDGTRKKESKTKSLSPRSKREAAAAAAMRRMK
eukprot:g603.t1